MLRRLDSETRLLIRGLLGVLLLAILMVTAFLTFCVYVVVTSGA